MITRLPVPLGGGVNVFDDPIALPDGQWQRLRNLATRQTGVLGQRPSLSFARDVQPDYRWWDIRLFDPALTVPNTVAGYYKWAQYIRPVKFLFDPNYGELSIVAVTIAPWLVFDGVALVNVTLPADTVVLINLPQRLSSSGSDPIVQVAQLGSASRDVSLFVFDGTTYAFGGPSNGVHIDPPVPTGFPEQVNYQPNDFGAGNESFNPDGACAVRDRVVYFKGSNLYWSDRNEPLSISTAGIPALSTREIFLGGEELESITAVAELSTSADGSPVQSVAAAWTSTRMYMLLGEPGETTETDVIGSLQINRLNIEAGCVSQATVCRTPYGTVWAGRDDVWFMPFGALPIRVGTSIRPLLQNQPSATQWRMHAEYYNGVYRLSMFSPGQGPATFDPCGMQMWLDFSKGAPTGAADARWFGPQEFVQTDAPTAGGGDGGPAGVWCMARDTRANGDNRLYSLQSYIIPGGDLPSVFGMSLCTLESYDGKDYTAPQGATSDPWQAGYSYAEGDVYVPSPKADAAPLATPIWICTTGGTSGGSVPSWLASTGTGAITDGSVVWKLKYWDGTYPMSAYYPNMRQGANQIEWSALSKEYTMGDPMAEKLLDGAELGYWALDRTQVTYNSHAKQDSQSRILGLDAGQIADNVANQTTGDRVWQRRLLTPSPTKRFRGLTAAWEGQQDAGIVITAGVNDSIEIDNGGGLQAFTIPAGYYPELLAVAAAIEAAVSGVFSTILADGGYIRALAGFYRDVGTIQIGTGSRLAQLFGFSPRQGATVSNAGVAYGYESPRVNFAPDMQLSGLNLRFKTFGRRPQ